MAIPASGAFRASAIRDTFGGPQTFRLGDYRRDPVGPYVYANAANNPAVNHAAAVTLVGVPLLLNVFRGQLPGWTYTNATVRTNNFTISTGFGDNWGTNWPKTFVNNAVIGSTSTATYACVISGGANRVDFVNNSEIQGAGGQPNSNPGQIALRLTALTCTLYITNNGAIRGGGGAGGVGGYGGTGGTGYYNYTQQEGPTYNTAPTTYWVVNQRRYNTGSTTTNSAAWWGGAVIFSNFSASQPSPYAQGGINYFRGAQQSLLIHASSPGTPNPYTDFKYTYQIYRQYTATAYVGGAGGGAGGNGGRGIGYNSPNLGGSPGAGGGNNGGNSGVGGTGGTGGTGGSWGLPGGTGGTGATGATGNYTGGTGGAGGGAGGAGGYSIYADSAFHLPVRGTLNGTMGPTQPS